jgi:hypothetical protein
MWPVEDLVVPTAGRCAPDQQRGVFAAIGRGHPQRSLMHVLGRPVRHRSGPGARLCPLADAPGPASTDRAAAPTGTPHRSSRRRSSTHVTNGSAHRDRAGRTHTTRRPPDWQTAPSGRTDRKVSPATVDPFTASHVRGVRHGSRILRWPRSTGCDIRRGPVRFATVRSPLLYRLLYFSPALRRVEGASFLAPVAMPRPRRPLRVFAKSAEGR